jgi:hypothetical protein
MVNGPGPVPTWDWLVAPAIREAHILIPGVIFWFLAQYVIGPFVGRTVFPKYRSLSKKDQVEWDVRFVSALNSIICFGGAYTWLTGDLSSSEFGDLYAQVPAFSFNRAWIVSYFIWDVIACVAHDWGFAFTAHGVAALTGSYFLMYPFSDAFGPWYTAVFELSNVFIHFSKLMSAVGTLKRLARISELTFAGMFFFIRVLGGSYYFAVHMYYSVVLLQEGKQHATVPVVFSMVNVTFLIGLQYYWFKIIVDVAMGWKTW